jgi:hypothetical protein
MPGRVVLVLHRHGRDVSLVQPVDRHVAVHLQGEDPQQVGSERPLQDVVEDRDERALRMRLGGGHLLLGHQQGDVEQPAGHRVPALDRGEHAAAATHVGADEGLADGAGSVREVLALHVHPIEGVGGRGQADAVDVGQ